MNENLEPDNANGVFTGTATDGTDSAMLDRTASQRAIPFYGSYALFYRAMKAFKKRGLPRRVETRFLQSDLGYEAGRVSPHFASVGWIDEDGRPSADLHRMVDAFGTESWTSTLSEIVPRTYSFIPKPWEELTGAKLREAFISFSGREAGALVAAETFFLCVATEAGVELPETLYRRVGRAVAEARKLLRGDNDNRGTDGSETDSVEATPLKKSLAGDRTTQSADPSSRWVRQILDLTALIDDRMTDREKSAVLTILGYLRRRAEDSE